MRMVSSLVIFMDSAILPAKGRILVSLNIKNPKAYELAHELAALTGESLTAAVIVALAERLEAEKVSRGLIKSKLERMRELAVRFKAGMDPTFRSEDHAAMLFDENGMPF